MANIIINPTTDADVIALGERIERIRLAKELYLNAKQRYLKQNMLPGTAQQVAVRTLAVNGFDRPVVEAALTELNATGQL